MTTPESDFLLPAVCQGGVTPNWGDRSHALQSGSTQDKPFNPDNVVVPRDADVYRGRSDRADKPYRTPRRRPAARWCGFGDRGI